MRTSARLLYDVLTFVYDRLGFDAGCRTKRPGRAT